MTQLALFENHSIRRVQVDGVVHFSVIDVIDALEVSNTPKRYWSDLKPNIEMEIGQPYALVVRFKLPAADGKLRLTDCATAEGIFRILQSVPSPKVEPFKRWLAKIAVERIEEEANPDLAVDRAILAYRRKGWDQRRIELRIKGIMKRRELTDDWKDRGITEGRHYQYLTSAVHQGAIGWTPTQHRAIKGLPKKASLRDNCTDTELALITLGEVATMEVTREKDAQGYDQLLAAAQAGGRVAGDARRSLEKQLGRPIVAWDDTVS